MKSVILLPILALTAFMASGCGDLSIGDQVQLNVDLQTQTAELSVEMSDGLQINMLNGAFPLPDGAGELVFVPATQQANARIAVRANLAVLAGDYLGNINAISSLPNGSPLPVAVTPPLLSVPVLQNQNFKVAANFSITPEVQIGATIGIAQLNSRYVPEGIAICQNFRNEQNLAFAAVCLYGPGQNEYGGIFVGANLGDLFHQEQSPALASAMLMSSAPMSRLSSSASWASSSDDYSFQTHDPKRDLTGSRGLKALRNVQKILRVR